MAPSPSPMPPGRPCGDCVAGGSCCPPISSGACGSIRPLSWLSTSEAFISTGWGGYVVPR
eukprot:CAMPEP_0172068184 /NCGR_PEP_ID=MMETSP1043-20130122/12081_1 /TAXON_ID=464988 /ORGANISM="Hemiselmis andersenii, Strain CCMP441" /LENGTH=59 /DNA_ID=CAMNT_0012728437 /DNA_START=144 /DNA_END=320 /DNA_ORIENTATION=-